MAKPKQDPSNKVVGTNRKATYDYFVEEKIEARPGLGRHRGQSLAGRTFELAR